MMTPDNLPGFQVAIEIVIGIAVVVGFLVIFQAMYTAVMERTREIGILKSMGASKLYIMNVVLRETLLLAVLGIIAGILIEHGDAARHHRLRGRCSDCFGATHGCCERRASRLLERWLELYIRRSRRHRKIRLTRWLMSNSG